MLLIELYYLKMFLEKVKDQVNQTLVIWFNFLENRIAFIRSLCFSVLVLGWQLDNGSAVVELVVRKLLCHQRGAVHWAGGWREARLTLSWPADQWCVLLATENVGCMISFNTNFDVESRVTIRCHVSLPWTNPMQSVLSDMQEVPTGWSENYSNI